MSSNSSVTHVLDSYTALVSLRLRVPCVTRQARRLRISLASMRRHLDDKARAQTSPCMLRSLGLSLKVEDAGVERQDKSIWLTHRHSETSSPSLPATSIGI